MYGQGIIMFYSKYTGTIYAQGVILLLCGKPTTPEGLAECICGGKDTYSPSFVYDAEGNLSEVRYDRTGDVCYN